MGLEPCRECGREVSRQAGSCPDCGMANPSGTWAGAFAYLGSMNVGCLLLIIVATLLLIGLVMSLGA